MTNEMERLLATFAEYGYEMETSEVYKNGKRLTAIFPASTKNSTIRPVAYLEYLVEQLNEKTYGEIVEIAIELFTRNLTENTEDIFVMITNPANLRLGIRAKSEQPGIKFSYLDLEVYVYSKLNDNASTVLREEHLSCFDMTRDEMIEKATLNTRSELIANNLANAMFNFGNYESVDCFDFSKSEPPMYIVTTKGNFRGAIALFYNDVMRKIADELNSDLLIIPSSTEEIIVIKLKDSMHNGVISEYIKDTNANHVRPEEVLVNHPYVFRRTSGVVTYEN